MTCTRFTNIHSWFPAVSIVKSSEPEPLLSALYHLACSTCELINEVSNSLPCFVSVLFLSDISVTSDEALVILEEHNDMQIIGPAAAQKMNSPALSTVLLGSHHKSLSSPINTFIPLSHCRWTIFINVYTICSEIGFHNTFDWLVWPCTALFMKYFEGLFWHAIHLLPSLWYLKFTVCIWPKIKIQSTPSFQKTSGPQLLWKAFITNGTELKVYVIAFSSTTTRLFFDINSLSFCNSEMSNCIKIWQWLPEHGTVQQLKWRNIFVRMGSSTKYSSEKAGGYP